MNVVGRRAFILATGRVGVVVDTFGEPPSPSYRIRTEDGHVVAYSCRAVVLEGE